MGLDAFDVLPEDMMNYLRYNGRHFSRKLCDFAVSKMYRVENGQKKKISSITKDQLDTLLKNYNITINNNQLYDYVYVANMCKADYFGSSITDDLHLLLYVKDTIDDPDGYDGLVFNRWYADTVRKGMPIDWREML